MIDGLANEDLQFLGSFYSVPNGLEWKELEAGTAPTKIADAIRPWVQRLASGNRRAPLLLPFIREGQLTGWYATARSAEGASALEKELMAWIGPSYWTIWSAVPVEARDQMAKSMRERFGNTVYRFAGSDAGRNVAIASRVSDLDQVLKMRPEERTRVIRPFGSIRGDFERALLARDETRAEEMIAELRATGRLNEENLRYLDVRLKAGMGYWPQIARNHWLIATLSDLALPPQSLTDVVEALYRTYVEQAEAGGSASAVLDAFDINIARRYPRLFSTRRGIRNPRVLKSFLLFERLRSSPDIAIIDDLCSLLPAGDREAPWVREINNVPVSSTRTASRSDADAAFEDENYDRAFEHYLVSPLTVRSLNRLLLCVTMIGTDEVKRRLLAEIDAQATDLLDSLTPKQEALIEGMRERRPPTGLDGSPGWMNWAQQVADGRDLPDAEASARDAALAWDIEPFKRSEQLSDAFAALIGNVDGASALLIRQCVPYLMNAFFASEQTTSATLRPIAATLFLLIAMDDKLTGVDLELLVQLLDELLAMGLSEKNYVSLINDLEDVQNRVVSLSHLDWSLDISEMLAVAPCPSASAREARLRFFSRALAGAQSFVHRLEQHHLIAISFLAKDFGVELDSSEFARARNQTVDASSTGLSGKKIGIYTLAESAGSRAKAALEEMYPGCLVEVNSDLVATPQLANLAATADLFLFAWKASSHAAFNCVQDAMPRGSKPIFPPGKGTASILTAVKDSLS
jgi:hypothetical protein